MHTYQIEYAVYKQTKYIETYTVEAESEDEAQQYFLSDGKLIETTSDEPEVEIDSDILSIIEIS